MNSVEILGVNHKTINRDVRGANAPLETEDVSQNNVRTLQMAHTRQEMQTKTAKGGFVLYRPPHDGRGSYPCARITPPLRQGASGRHRPRPSCSLAAKLGHIRRRSSAAGFSSSVPAPAFSHRPISALPSTTGMRSWIGRVNSFASVTMIVHEITGSPVSGFFHLSHRPAKPADRPTS